MEETRAILKDLSARKYNNLHYDRLRKSRKELTWALSERRVKKSDVNSIEELLNTMWSFFEDTSNKSTRLRLHIQVEHAMRSFESLKEDLSRYKEKQAARIHKGPTDSRTKKTTVNDIPDGKVIEEISQGQEGKNTEEKRDKHVNFSDKLYVSTIISTHLPSLRSVHHSNYTTDLHPGKSSIDKKEQQDPMEVAEKKNAEEASPAIREVTPQSILVDSTNSSRVSSETRITNNSGSKVNEWLMEQDEETIADTREASSAKPLSDNGEERKVHNDNVKGLATIRTEVSNLKKEFSQLYQSQWMDAFVELSESVPSEEDIISKLLNIVMYAFQYCVKTAKRQMKNIETAFKKEILFPNDSKVVTQGNNEKANSFDPLPSALITLRNLRQQVAHTSLPALIPMVVRHIEKNIVSPVNPDSRLFLYIEQCVELTWLMCIQDNPMYLYKCEPATAHQDKFRSYTRSGPLVKYCVWPCLYLHEGGPLLDEGIAQMQ